MKLVAPDPYSTTIDQVCAEDAAWFEAHPGVTVRSRPARAGEFWPLLEPLPPAKLVAVRVTLLGPGVRTREPVLEGIREGESALWAVYDEEQPGRDEAL